MRAGAPPSPSPPHLSVRLLSRFAVEGSSPDQPLSDIAPCLPHTSIFASKPTAMRRLCRNSRPRRSAPAALPAAPIACAKASRLSRRFACAACSTEIGGRHPLHGHPHREAEGAALLGPLVVDPLVKARVMARRWLRRGWRGRGTKASRLVLLVGDMPYYGRFGFQPVPPGQITLPGPVDPGAAACCRARARRACRRGRSGQRLRALMAFAEPGCGQEAEQQAEREEAR